MQADYSKALVCRAVFKQRYRHPISPRPREQQLIRNALLAEGKVAATARLVRRVRAYNYLNEVLDSTVTNCFITTVYVIGCAASLFLYWASVVNETEMQKQKLNQASNPEPLFHPSVPPPAPPANTPF